MPRRNSNKVAKQTGMASIAFIHHISPFLPTVPFLYPLKTEKPNTFLCI